MNWLQLADAVQKEYDKLSPYEKAILHLRAVAMWTDKELENPMCARACRDCAVKGLQDLNETLQL